MRKKIKYFKENTNRQEVMSNVWDGYDFDHDLERSKYINLTNIHNSVIYNYLKNTKDHKVKILDAGCGKGRILRYYSKMDLKIYGIDILENIVAEVRQNFPELNIRKGSAENIPFESNYFDIYLSVGLLRWIKPERVDLIFSEANRVLNKNGTLILDTPLQSNLWSLIQLFKNIKDRIISKSKLYKKAYEIYYSVKDVKKMCEKANFKIEKIYIERAPYLLNHLQKFRVFQKTILKQTNNPLYPFIYKGNLEKIVQRILTILNIYGGAVVIIAKKG